MTDNRASDGDDPGRRLEEILAEHREPEENEDATTDAAERDPFDPFAPVPDATGEGDEAGEGAEEEDPLPDAPLFALLRTIETGLRIDRIDRIWVFPPRRLQAGETAVVVVAAYTEPRDDRRRVYAAHYTAHEEAREPHLALDEYGTAPTERVGRLVEEVVERLKEDPTGAPRSHGIDGQEDRWNAVLHQLAEAYLAEVRKNSRLRP